MRASKIMLIKNLATTGFAPIPMALYGLFSCAFVAWLTKMVRKSTRNMRCEAEIKPIFNRQK
jgi:hypothetical protein